MSKLDDFTCYTKGINMKKLQKIHLSSAQVKWMLLQYLTENMGFSSTAEITGMYVLSDNSIDLLLEENPGISQEEA